MLAYQESHSLLQVRLPHILHIYIYGECVCLDGLSGHIGEQSWDHWGKHVGPWSTFRADEGNFGLHVVTFVANVVHWKTFGARGKTTSEKTFRSMLGTCRARHMWGRLVGGNKRA